MIECAPIRQQTTSARWDGPDPAITVIVSTLNRAVLIDDLLDALERQEAVDAEVVVADNGSTDDTWRRLTERCAVTSLRLRAIRLDPHSGPGIPRNTAISVSRGHVLAFTDDDCLPEPTWLAALLDEFDRPATVLVQGRTTPEEGVWSGPWQRTVRITELSGLYETCNLATRRTCFEQVGGVAAPQWLTGRAFGEDAVFGTKAEPCGEVRFAERAIVRHRMMPGTYRDHLNERVRLRGFPHLIRAVPHLRRRLTGGVFLSRRTALTDLGVAAVVAAAVTKRSWPLAAALPWGLRLCAESAARPGRARAVRVAQIAAADVVGLAALACGSAQSRTLVL